MIFKYPAYAAGNAPFVLAKYVTLRGGSGTLLNFINRAKTRGHAEPRHAWLER